MTTSVTCGGGRRQCRQLLGLAISQKNFLSFSLLWYVYGQLGPPRTAVLLWFTESKTWVMVGDNITRSHKSMRWMIKARKRHHLSGVLTNKWLRCWRSETKSQLGDDIKINHCNQRHTAHINTIKINIDSSTDLTSSTGRMKGYQWGWQSH